MATQKRRSANNSPTRHHIIPTSRGGKDGENIAIVPRKEHQLYHQMFSNMTPDEIICYLVTAFWNDQWVWVDMSYRYGGK